MKSGGQVGRIGRFGVKRMFDNIYSGKRVLITGHTGFKGSWLALWLYKLGAKVAGYSVDVPSQPSNYEVLQLDNMVKNYRGDVRDREKLSQVFDEFRPEIVFHLAAQPLVRKSYLDPVTTFETNAMGTLNMLECIRARPDVRVGVIITSDKCYRNVEWIWGYRENDLLGGEDPYSGSKGCAELVSYSYIHSYFINNSNLAAVATTRAGNVIGGGDWADDRIVPDCIRAWARGEVVPIRSPRSTRPWQHVLDPLSGYLCLGGYLWRRDPKAMSESYNFGPDATVNRPVEELIKLLGELWGDAKWQVNESGLAGRPEAGLLKLSCDKALADLKWRASLAVEEAVCMTSQWYQQYYQKKDTDMLKFTLQQIEHYSQLAFERNLNWARN